MRVSWLLHAALITHLVFHVRATCDVESYKKCDSPKKYHCQYEASTDTPVEFCAIPIWCNAGNHAVLYNVTKNVTCEECAEGMFQSERKYSNIFIQPNCDERVTLCNEKEYVCENATTRQNTKCACNETAGYKQTNKQTNCNQVCFSKDSVCGCELQDLSPPSTPVLTNETTTTTTTDAASTHIVLSSVLPVIGLVIAAILVYLFKCRKSKGKAGKDEDAVERAPLQRKRNPPGRGIEIDETETEDFDDSKERIKVTGLRDNAQAENVNTAGKVFGGMGHFFVLNCCNNSTSGEEKVKKTDKITEENEQRDMRIDVTGVKDKAIVGTANVAGFVKDGMGNNNRSGVKRDAPLASSEDL